MNVRSLALAAIVAWVVDSIYGYVVFGLMLSDQYKVYPEVFRSFEQVNTMLPLMFGSSFLGFLVIAFIFAKGHEGGPGIVEGLKFGIAFALFGLFMISIPNYVVLRYGYRLAAPTAVAAFVEMLLSGLVLGIVYRPAAVRAARSSAA